MAPLFRRCAYLILRLDMTYVSSVEELESKSRVPSRQQRASLDAHRCSLGFLRGRVRSAVDESAEK